MASVALVISPFFWTKTPHLGLEFLQQALKKDHKADIFDLNIAAFQLLRSRRSWWDKLDYRREAEFYRYLKDYFPFFAENALARLRKYDIVGLSVFQKNFFFSQKLAQELKESGFGGNIIFGGPEGEKAGRLLNCPYVQGEGERAIKEIARGHMKNYGFLETDNLDSLPFLDFCQFNLKAFPPVLPLLSSRGCINKCRFCTEWRLYKKFRQHSPKYMVEQIKKLKNTYAINYFSFQDSLINASLSWLEKFGRLLLKENLKILWEAQMIIRSDMPKELLHLLKQSGCVNIFFGLESASEKVLKHMGKRFSPLEAQTLFKRLSQLEMHFEVSLIVGYPQEEENDFQQTLAFLKQNKRYIPKIAQINPFVLLEKSLLAEEDTKLLPKEVVRKRLIKTIKFVKREKIRHRLSFINNLAYGN